MSFPNNPSVFLGLINQYEKLNALDPTAMSTWFGPEAGTTRSGETGYHSHNLNSINRLVTISEKLFRDIHYIKEVPITRWVSKRVKSEYLLASYRSYDLHYFRAGVHTTHAVWTTTDFGTGKELVHQGGPFRVTTPLYEISATVSVIDSPYWNLVSQQVIENILYKHTVADLVQGMHKHKWVRCEQLYSLQSRNKTTVTEDLEFKAAGNYYSLLGRGEHMYDTTYIQVGKAPVPPDYVPADIKKIPRSRQKVPVPKPTKDYVSPWYTRLQLPYGTWLLNSSNMIVINSQFESIRMVAKKTIHSKSYNYFNDTENSLNLRVSDYERVVKNDNESIVVPPIVSQDLVLSAQSLSKTKNTYVDIASYAEKGNSNIGVTAIAEAENSLISIKGKGKKLSSIGIKAEGKEAIVGITSYAEKDNSSIGVASLADQGRSDIDIKGKGEKGCGINVNAQAGSKGKDAVIRIKSDREGKEALVEVKVDNKSYVVIRAENIYIEAATGITIKSPEVKIDSSSVLLGSGKGRQVARVGDKVKVGNAVGVIIEGSTKVRAS